MKYRYRPKNIQIRNRIIAIVTATTIGLFAGFYLNKSKSKTYNEFKNPSDIESNIDYDFYSDIDYIVDQSIDELADSESVNEEIKMNFVEEPSTPITVVETSTPAPVVESVVSTPIVEIATPVPVKKNGGDSVFITDTVNMRFDSNTHSYILGQIPSGYVVDRIMSIGDWDLVKYGDNISYVSSKYTRENDVDYNNEYYNVEEYYDIAISNENLNFRLGPSTNEKSLFKLEKDEEVSIIGKAIVNNNADDLWYVARARGKIGFISSKHVRTLSESIKQMDPSINDVKVKKMGYISHRDGAYVTDSSKNYINYLDQYQLVQVLNENKNRYLVNVDGNIGYVNKNDVRVLDGSFVAVDISSQRVYYYVDNDTVFRSKCTTGRDGKETDLGLFTPYCSTNEHDFGNNLKATILWRPWSEEGFHDASWEPEEKFGDLNYRVRSGSGGCVRLPDDAAYFFRENIPSNTSVLIKE